MSHVSEWGHHDLYKWTVERPVEGRNRFSPLFTYESVRGPLKFSLEIFVENKTYTMRFKGTCYAIALGDLIVDVHVEDRGGRALPLSYKAVYKYSNNYLIPPVLWKYNEPDILKAIPDFHSNGLLIFLIIFRYPHGTTLLEQPTAVSRPKPAAKVEEKSVQTDDGLCANCATASCFESLSEDLAKLLEEEKGSKPDVTLVCGDSELGAHRAVLAARSKVFAAMLRHDSMVEGRSGIVEIRDMEPAIFRNFVRYMYAGQLPDLTVDTAVRFYEAADKYAVAGLARRCARFLRENMDVENACELLKLADAHSDVDFKEAAMDYILEKEIHLQDDPWLSFCKGQPVLANEVLNRFCKLQKKKCNVASEK